MKLRTPFMSEMNSIYMMGFDVWSDGESVDDYLKGCNSSNKYKQGQWYCLERKNEVVSSLISYDNCFGLAEKYYGLGSVATQPSQRGKGYASSLIQQYVDLLNADSAAGVFLFSDINPSIYAKLGFNLVEGYEEQGLMSLNLNGRMIIKFPDYF